MTESNLFCYSTSYNDDDSFQQKRFRIFNKQVAESRYREVTTLVREILPKQGALLLTDYWRSVTQEQWTKLLAIPEAADFKEGYEYISGVKIVNMSSEGDWQNQYPLNTFEGETKKELVEFIHKLI
jgi:hypothetical protein